MYHELCIHLYMLHTDSHHINLGYQLETWVILGNENQHFKSLFDLNTGFGSRHLNVAPHTGHIMHNYQRCGVSIYSFLLSRGLYPRHSSWASTKNHLPSELAVTTPEEREVRTGSRHLLPISVWAVSDENSGKTLPLWHTSEPPPPGSHLYLPKHLWDIIYVCCP